MPKVDVLLPSKGDRPNGLLFQIHTVLNQSHKDIKLWVLLDNEIDMQMPKDDRIEVSIVPKEFHGNYGHNAVKWALGNLDLQGEWLYIVNDDNVMTEWAIESLLSESEGYDLVTGISIATDRNHNMVSVLGVDAKYAKISGECCFWRLDTLKKTGYDNTAYHSDWINILNYVQQNLPIKQTIKVLSIQPMNH